MYAGLEIGGTKIQIFVTDNDLNIIERYKTDVGEVKKSEIIREKISVAVNSLITKYNINAFGAGFGGPIDWKSGKIGTSYHVSGWTDFELKNWLQEIIKVPVFVDNDANIAALAESYLGAGKGLNRVFYITLGSGVGGGFIINGEIYHGSDIGEFEIGHIRLDKSGTIIESNCSGWAVDKKIKEYVKTKPDSVIAKIIGENTGNEAGFLAKAIEKGDKGAKQILIDTADDLAFGLSHVMHIVHPEIIILGGGLSLIGEPLLSAIETSLPKYLMNIFTKPTLLKTAGLIEDVVVMGAALLAKMKFKDHFRE